MAHKHPRHRSRYSYTAFLHRNELAPLQNMMIDRYLSLQLFWLTLLLVLSYIQRLQDKNKQEEKKQAIQINEVYFALFNLLE